MESSGSLRADLCLSVEFYQKCVPAWASNGAAMGGPERLGPEAGETVARARERSIHLTATYLHDKWIQAD